MPLFLLKLNLLESITGFNTGLDFLYDNFYQNVIVNVP